VLKALEGGQTGYMDGGATMGPEGFRQALLVLSAHRPIRSIARRATCDYVKMPDGISWASCAQQEENLRRSLRRKLWQAAGRKVPGGNSRHVRRLM